jgi:hypothetical protein
VSAAIGGCSKIYCTVKRKDSKCRKVYSVEESG